MNKNRKAFTLIELLATLAIMAIMAVILFPILANYVAKANHDTSMRSLRILQEAMDRYRSVNPDFDQWAIGSSGIMGNPPLDIIRVLTSDEVHQVFDNILTRNSNQTLKIPIDQLTPANIVIVSTGLNQLSSGWEVMWFRRNANVTGVDRKGNDVANTNVADWLPTPEEIDSAFQ